jgi:drug/metabolite transporter (DMT)-like permease
LAGLTAAGDVGDTGAAPRAWATPRPLLPELALIGATIAFGTTFKVVQDALDRTTPTGFILLRFTIGALVLAPFAIRAGWRPSGASADLPPPRPRPVLRTVVVFGAVGFGGYWFQNAGLQHTTTSNSAFITGLFVVFAPLFETIARRRLPPRNVVAAVVLATIGLFLLTGAQLTLGRGDALTLACAACFGLWIYLGGQYSQRYNAVTLTAAQMAVLALLAVPFVAVEGMGHVDGGVVAAALVTGVLCSAVAFSLQLWGQRYVEPSRAAVILLFEPVVAGVVGYAVGERLDVNGYVGAAVILGSIVVAELAAWRRPAAAPAGAGAA